MMPTVLPRSSARVSTAQSTITPGMPAEVYIVTGERTMLQYLLKPFTDTLRQSFRET